MTNTTPTPKGAVIKPAIINNVGPMLFGACPGGAAVIVSLFGPSDFRMNRWTQVFL